MIKYCLVTLSQPKNTQFDVKKKYYYLRFFLFQLDSLSGRVLFIKSTIAIAINFNILSFVEFTKNIFFDIFYNTRFGNLNWLSFNSSLDTMFIWVINSRILDHLSCCQYHIDIFPINVIFVKKFYIMLVDFLFLGYI